MDNAKPLDDSPVRTVDVCAPVGTKPENISHFKDLKYHIPGKDGSPKFCSRDGVENFCDPGQYCKDVDNKSEHQDISPLKASCPDFNPVNPFGTGPARPPDL